MITRSPDTRIEVRTRQEFEDIEVWFWDPILCATERLERIAQELNEDESRLGSDCFGRMIVAMTDCDEDYISFAGKYGSYPCMDYPFITLIMNDGFSVHDSMYDPRIGAFENRRGIHISLPLLSHDLDYTKPRTEMDYTDMVGVVGVVRRLLALGEEIHHV